MHGNYWIGNKEKNKKVINIEGQKGKWKVTSNELYQIINPKNVIVDKDGISVRKNKSLILKEFTLKEYSFTFISIANSKELFILYVMPSYENKYKKYKLKDYDTILIGSDKECDIQYSENFVAEQHTKLKYSNNRWIIQNIDNKFGTYVNDIPVNYTTRVLLNGDVIFVMGLKLIIIGDYVYINNPNDDIVLSDIFEEVQETKFSLKEKIEDDEVEIVGEKEYYVRAPRIINKIEREQVRIEAPPAAQNDEKMPAILVMGSTMIMGIISVVSMTSSLGSLANGEAFTFGKAVQLIISILMLFSMLGIPILQRKYEAKRKKNYEDKRQKRYGEYINKKIKEIDDITEKQKNILYSNFASAEECENIVLSRSPRLWERKIENYDFLTIRLGTGEIPLEMDIQYPEKSFTMDDDNLLEMINALGKKSKTLKNAPITLSLIDNNLTGIIADDEIAKKYMRNIILQLITFHSYADLKLVFLLKEDINSRWSYLKMLPHVWNNAKTIRFFSDDEDEIREIAFYLEEEVADRFNADNVDYRKCSPYYLIITDDYRRIENLKIIIATLKSKVNVGISILCIADDINLLPNECKTFIELGNGTGTIFESEMTSDKQKKFAFDVRERIFFEKINQEISNIAIKYNKSGVIGLPSKYTFLEMYDVGTIDELNILERWKKNNSTVSLKAPIGIDNTGNMVALDVHERYHGPHGLIAGSTGSGKSEFIITFILSLAINYHPDDVAFVLIDYKGGGLAGAFKKRDIKLPHLVGVITNIDTAGLRRSLASIQSELRRRQIIFNKARDITNEGTIDIYKYQKLYHDGIVEEPIPHLLIICDEFAELKQQQPEFMDELISVARIGRSLGVHLILSTQKPAGVVNDQIRSNSKFSVCLKVQEKQDSIDVIKRPDAANLKNPGQFFMVVGNDEYVVLGQSGWAGAPYIPNVGNKVKEDKSIEFISSIGSLLKKIDDTEAIKAKSDGEQLTKTVEYIYKLANSEKIVPKQLWLESIPEIIYLADLKEKYGYKVSNEPTIVIGEYDDPQNQYQGIVDINLVQAGNILIYGSADSGKETLLSTIVYDAMSSYSPEKIWFYLLDFGSEALKIFKNAPHIGDVVLISETEKIERFFKMIQNEINKRKSILSEYNGDYNLYNEANPNSLPIISVVINNYEGFSEFYQDKYDDILLTISREGIKCGVMFILTVSNYTDVRYRLAQNFKQKIALRLNNDDDYYNIFDNVGKKRPANLFGRGLVSIDDSTFEFQTAKICEPAEWNVRMKDEIQILNKAFSTKAKPIPTMPKKVTFEDVKEAFAGIDSVPIGINKQELTIYTYNYSKSFVNIISSKNIDSAENLAINIFEELKELDSINLCIIDAERIYRENKNDLKEDYENFINALASNSSKRTVCMIIGVNKFIDELDNGETRFSEILKSAENVGNISFILVEKASKLKEHEFEPWYKSHISGEDGIWVGSGIDNQYLIRTNINGRRIVNNCGPNYAYVVNQGEPTLIKIIGANEEEDENG